MRTRWDSARRRARDQATRTLAWWETARRRRPLLDLGNAYYERDQEAHGSVLGSAIALRLFLFVIPATVMLVALVHLFGLWELFDEYLESSVTTGDIARNLDSVDWWSCVPLFLSGLVFTLWAGRGLARVLASSSGSAWQLPVRKSKPGVVNILVMTGILFASYVAGGVFTRLREVGGAAVFVTSWTAILVVAFLTWFIISMTMPRGTSDPGALLPGSALFMVAYSALQWFMYYYLPRSIERTSDTFGDMATTLAALGNFFAIGRLVTITFTVNAVTYERFGSFSQFVFDLPLVRRVPRRFPKLADFLDLDVGEPAPPEDATRDHASRDDASADDAPPSPAAATPVQGSGTPSDA